MAGAMLSVGVVLCTATLAVGYATVGAAAVESQRVAGIADAAALAAADAASGAVSGQPCTRAAEIASAMSASVDVCTVAELVATVTVSTRFGAFLATASARAGPPD